MNLKLKIILRTELFDSSTLISIVKEKNKLVEITRFGYTEPLKNKVDIRNLNPIVFLYKEYLDIIFKGKRKFWLSGSAFPEGLLMFGGGIEIKTSEKNKINDLINFIQLFDKGEQLLYAYMCTEEEYDEKHKVIKGSGCSWKGVSKWDFLEYSPGIHWYTVMCKKLIDSIGSDKIKNIENVHYCNLGTNSIAFHLNEPIEYNEDRLSTIEAIENRIGEHLFFNKNLNEEKLSHPESFKQYLNSFGRGY